jgi:hypothetical protein
MPYLLLPLLMLASGAALATAAEPGAAESCAANLGPDARSIYAEAALSMKPGADLKAVLTRVMMPKVMSGAMNRRTATPLAEEASHCLELIQ